MVIMVAAGHARKITDPAHLAELERQRQEFERERRRFFLRRKPITLPEARAAVGMYCGSYSRMHTIIRLWLKRRLSKGDTLTVLGERWSDCDDVGRHADMLRIFLPDGPAPEMMTEPERAALAALPESVTIYRGADRGVNEQGLSWSLERAVAARFPFLDRYRAKRPVLVTATVQREHIIALKFDREEAEVITKRAIVSSVAELEPPPDDHPETEAQ